MNDRTSQINLKRPRDTKQGDSDHWQTILAQAVRDPVELCRRLGLPTEMVGPDTGFSTLVPEPFLRRIKPGHPADPLLLQVFPRKEESNDYPGFTTDPVGENGSLSPDGTLSKYRGRSLIVTSKACGVHCRFCFRRHLPPCGGIGNADSAYFGVDPEAVAAHFEADPTLQEAILSGGDPLILDDPQLETLIKRLDQVPHLRRIRIHTRMPVMIPQRITDRLLETLKGDPGEDRHVRRVVVLHVNHANELDAEVVQAIERLAKTGCLLLSQSVLLRQINDSVAALCDLFECLVGAGVIPYYLHQLDRVAGAAHFEVDPCVGKRLIAQLRERLPGYAVPRYVREVPGESGKVVLM